MTEMVTILVAGHRLNRLPSGEKGTQLFAELDRILSVLCDVARDGQTSLRVLTGVASGTDDATARIAERLDLPLHLLAPRQPESLTAGQQRAERMVWLGTVDRSLDDDEAFTIRDEMALSFADLLILVWDGESPHGLSGSTVRLAFRAALMMKPVIWLNTDGTVRVLGRNRIDALYSQKLRCLHPEPSWLCDCFTLPLDQQALRLQFAEAMRLIVDPSCAASDDVVLRLKAYKAVDALRSAPTRAGQLDEAMMALIRFDLARLSKQFHSKTPVPYWGPAKADDDHPTIPTLKIDALFERSDVEASIASGRHRDMTWMLYGASAAAVFAAVAGAIGLWPDSHIAFWSITELVLIGGIVGGFWLAKSRRWHATWLGHRFIAEQLRYARMCFPFLGVPHPFMQPVWHVENGNLRLSSAELWLIQRTLSVEGLPCTGSSEAYDASSDAIKVRLAHYVSKVVKDQQNYHHEKHHKLHTAHERIHKLSMSLFGATALAVLAHFVVHANWLLICTAFFPALAAAVHGLSTKLEISRIAGQSFATEHLLADIAIAIDDAGSQAGWAGWLRLRQLALDASRIMSDENDQWQQLIRHQDTELPA